MKLIDLMGGAKAAALLGMCKNAGKTTALNRLIGEYAARGTVLGLTSIGRDGESRDLVTGTDKPPIYMYEGMLAATTEELLPLCDVTREILSLPGISTSLGQVVIFRARSDGFVQLAGPSIVEQLLPLRRELEKLGAECVLIDGALGRRSPAAGVPEQDGVCVLSTGASLNADMELVVEDTAFAARMLCLPKATVPGPKLDRFTLFRGNEAYGAADAGELCALLKKGAGPGEILLAGALTESQALALLRGGAKLEGLRLIAGDGSRYLLKRERFRKLEALGLGFAVLRPTRLAALTVNPVSAGGWRFDAGEFLEKMRAAVSVPVLDVEAEYGAEL
ncbi:MAG: hypothetical protein IJ705_02050 [Oscillospiraceae bacterium]|nr:hypothetical protein [Oscillospiraceae bacterium]